MVRPIVVSSSPTPSRAVDPGPILLTGALEAIVSDALAVGADGLEVRLMPEDLPDAEQIRDTVEDAGLFVSGISTGRMTREGGLLLSDPDAKVRQRGADALKAFVDIADVLKADVLVGSAKGNRSQEESENAYLERLLDPLEKVNEHSRGSDVRVQIEVINRYEINSLTTGVETRRFIEENNLDNCFVHLDSFHMNIEEVNEGQAIRDCGDRLGYIQFADSNRHWPGAGHINFNAYREALSDIGFEGVLSLECQPIPDGLTAARNGIEFLRKHMVF